MGNRAGITGLSVVKSADFCELMGRRKSDSKYLGILLQVF